MDPDYTLAAIREKFAEINAFLLKKYDFQAPDGTEYRDVNSDDFTLLAAAVEDLEESFKNLDEWLGAGQGFLPKDWRAGRNQ
jgi:hypothetical protein